MLFGNSVAIGGGLGGLWHAVNINTERIGASLASVNVLAPCQITMPSRPPGAARQRNSLFSLVAVQRNSHAINSSALSVLVMPLQRSRISRWRAHRSPPVTTQIQTATVSRKAFRENRRPGPT